MATDPNQPFGPLSLQQATAQRMPPLSPRWGTGNLLQQPYTAPAVKGWDQCKLGPNVLPGIWRIADGGILLRHDPKSKKGVDGARPTFHGMEPQQFTLEGMQWSDDQRDALVDVCSKILPVPGQSQNQTPLLLSHPSVAIFGWTVWVTVIGSSVLMYEGPGRTKLRLRCLHFMPPSTTAPSATNTPKRGSRTTSSTITDPKRNPNPNPNPPPTQQAGICGPPVGFTPEQ